MRICTRIVLALPQASQAVRNSSSNMEG